MSKIEKFNLFFSGLLCGLILLNAIAFFVIHDIQYYKGKYDGAVGLGRQVIVDLKK